MKKKKSIVLLVVAKLLTIDHSQYPSRSKKALSDMTEGLQDMVWETKTVYPKPVVVDNICIEY